MRHQTCSSEMYLFLLDSPFALVGRGRFVLTEVATKDLLSASVNTTQIICSRVFVDGIRY